MITDENRREKLNDEEDLAKIDEWELIRGCHLTGILSDIGYKHLDYIRDMRNWASAAHPNQNELTGFQLISWLETCIKEVIGKEPEGAVVEVRRFLTSIRNNQLSTNDASHINAGIEYLPTDIAKSLLRTLFGMYTAESSPVQVKANVRLVCAKAWAVAPKKPATNVASNTQHSRRMARRKGAPLRTSSCPLLAGYLIFHRIR